MMNLFWYVECRGWEALQVFEGDALNSGKVGNKSILQEERILGLTRGYVFDDLLRGIMQLETG